MTITFRRATEQDSEFFYATKKEALGPYIAQTWGWDEPFQIEFHQRDFKPFQIEIILSDSVPVGWLIKTKAADAWALRDIFLKASHQGRGIGGEILKNYISEADAFGVPIRLNVLKVNPAKLFYERHGFTVESVDEYHYKMIRFPSHLRSK